MLDWRIFTHRSHASLWANENPIREEVFGQERLEQHGVSLARAQKVTLKPQLVTSLHRRLADNEQELLTAHRVVAKAIAEGKSVTPGAEWLVNNSHVVEEQLRDIRKNLPPAYYQQLPKLAEGPLAGYPRILGVAWAFVAHSDSRFDRAMLEAFVGAYQTVETLTIGELWALPVTLRLVLVENLRRAARRIVKSRDERRDADTFADQLLQQQSEPSVGSVEPVSIFTAIGTLRTAFISQLIHRLGDGTGEVKAGREWLQEQLTRSEMTAEDVVRHEHQSIAATNNSVRHIIRSMRVMPDVDWPEFFESVSHVDAALNQDPIFPAMDFASRNSYRNVIEKLARRSQLSEVDIAKRAVSMAALERENVPDRETGYFLLGAGGEKLKSSISFRRLIRDIPAQITLKGGLPGYIGSIAFLALCILSVPCLALVGQGLSPLFLTVLALAGILPAIDLATAIVNQAITHELQPQIIPGLELIDGVPEAARTLIVIPSLIADNNSIDELLSRLEIHHLASHQENVFYALLSDWTDSPQEMTAADQELQRTTQRGIDRLNQQHPTQSQAQRFYLFHRKRQWNDREGVWMGWERKRGKLHELNRLLRGAQDTSFMKTDGRQLDYPEGVKYVITLDADTRLPRESARRLIGKMVHPFNRPVFSERLKRNVAGYGILQPRVTPSLPTDQDASLYQRLFSSAGGIEPYAGTISDVYQDLFGEGSFAGKGIYDIDAFESRISGRIRDNTVLSHDLLEGLYARAGLATDVEVVEDFPSRYDVARNREHRWVRGDWQLLPWILSGTGEYKRANGGNGLATLGRWKLADNLRRSLTPIAIIASLLLGWLLPAKAALIWTIYIVVSIVIPTFLAIAANLYGDPNNSTLQSHFSALGADARLAAAQSALHLTFIADKAYAMLDAIVRTIYRLFFSQRHLLEWTTAAQAKSMAALTTPAYYLRMSGGVLVALIALLSTLAFSSGGLSVALPVITLWFVAPAIARWASFTPAGGPREQLTAGNKQSLRLTARRTWRFFEDFVTAGNHYLPPDNFQEMPKAVVANRTSPTNVGLYLLSTVSAHDFGWISQIEAAERLEQTMRALSQLARYRGHFFNWYDTQSMAVLEPRYVSSVDSGNLAGHLIAAASACRQWAQTSGQNPAAPDGIADAMGLLQESVLAAERNPAVAEGIAKLQSVVKSSVALPEAEVGETNWASVREIALELASLLDHAVSTPMASVWARAVANTADCHRRACIIDAEGKRALRRSLTAIADAAEYMAFSMEFGFLLDQERELLSIGYSVDADRLDESCYDLLASEARLASFIAIAKGDLETRHWFRLGRTAVPIGRTSVLVSWSGSMFEYLMPDIVTLTPANSLLGTTARAAVNEQIRFGQRNGTPWGVSESAFNARDIEFTYQYSSFGVPELGLKRGLGENLVIAPYATGLASMVAPNKAAENFYELAKLGGCGAYGFYEAIDFTPARVAQSERYEVVKAYMAHHQGMTIVALANTVLDSAIARHFHASPMVQATELLLQERAPRLVPKRVQRATLMRDNHDEDELGLAAVRRVSVRSGATPDCHFLGNGRLSVMTTAAGSGYTRWKGLAITRWQGDGTLDNLGSFIYLRDRTTGVVWSAGHQPVGIDASSAQAAFTEDRVQLTRVDGTISTILDVIVSPEDDATCRRVSIRNTGKKPRTIDVTSYEELVLGAPEADAAHPAFSKLFVETEFDAGKGYLFANRRRRSPHDRKICVAGFVTCDQELAADFEYETDRAKFIGRGRTLASPISVINGRPLGGSVGCVIDPIFAIRQRIIVPPRSTVRLSFWTAVAEEREFLIPLIEKYKDASAFSRSATLAWTHGLVELRHLGIDADDAMLFQKIAGALAYSSPAFRASDQTLKAGALGFGALWAVGVSGDLPIVLVRIDEIDDIGLVRQLLHAYEYWRSKGIEADLVILNEHSASYQQELQTALETLCQSVPSRHRLGRDNSKGSVYLLRSDLLQPATLAALPSAARAVFHARRGALSEQVTRLLARAPIIAALPRRQAPPEISTERADTRNLEFFNGYGGFRKDGREYVVILDGGQTTPAPWINVIANKNFGFQVSAEGAGYTWCTNSKERQITPWSNDPVINRPGEVLYVRDEETGELWSPTASPLRDHAAPYVIAHGQGYTRFEHTSRGIELVLEQYLAGDDPVKISRLTLRNISGKPRKLSITSYVEWVLGSSRQSTAANINTEFDSQRGMISAKNAWHPFFPDRVAFATLSGKLSAWTADRGDFIGHDGTIDNPAGLAFGRRMRGTIGTGHDPCSVLQTEISLPAASQAEIVALLGDASSQAEACALADKLAGFDTKAQLESTVNNWDNFLSTIEIKTPDRALDLLVNRWLPYQTLSCRVWGRSGLYQAGGAYGYRDQLQDVMALAMTQPDLTRAHLLVAAGRQFPQGDVQHWWLPPSGHGIRTRIADSCLWLAYATAHYVKTTRDLGVLHEVVPFIDGPLLKEHEHEVYFLPHESDEQASLYEHCARAIDKSLSVGSHGLALFGGGDWNDGMNRVGIEGRGESIWLSWFIITCMKDMLPHAQAYGDTPRIERWQNASEKLRQAIEEHGWDGEWYRRGYFDDGSVLGSSSAEECQIDSIAQSWSVLSGAGNNERSRMAMASMRQRLIDREASLALLFTPAFDHTKLDPGYIKGYPPGVRENGGQYTHAAAWCIIALAELGEGDAAGDLLSLINPINLSATRNGSRKYRLEPYVVAADVYSVGENRGRGGWSWYTGAAGWIYRAAIEHVLGVRKEGDALIISPSIPSHWSEFEITYRHRNVAYHISVTNPGAVSRGLVAASDNTGELQIRDDRSVIVPLNSDKEQHIKLTMGLQTRTARAG